jgi:hypothetical protein
MPRGSANNVETSSARSAVVEKKDAADAANERMGHSPIETGE